MRVTKVTQHEYAPAADKVNTQTASCQEPKYQPHNITQPRARTCHSVAEQMTQVTEGATQHTM